MSEEKLSKMKEIKEALSAGDNQETACKKVGISTATYYNWRKAMKGKRPKAYKKKSPESSYTVMPMAMAQDDFQFKGSPDSLARFIKLLASKESAA